MEQVQQEDIPVLEPAEGGYFAIYDGRKIWHKNEFPSDYQPNLVDDIEPEIDREIEQVNLELDAISSEDKMKLKPPSDFVIAGQDVKDGDLITFLDEGKYNTLPQDPSREVLTFKVKIPSGEEKSISVNKTSQIELIKAWTDETSKWKGKKAKVKLVNQKVFQVFKDVIYLSPAEGKVASPKPTTIGK